MVEDIIREIENHKSGSEDPVEPWLRYSLSPIAYQHLKERLLTDDFVEDKLRYCGGTPVDGAKHSSLTSTLDPITSHQPISLCFGCHRFQEDEERAVKRSQRDDSTYQVS